MAQFIKAEVGLNNSIIYTDDESGHLALINYLQTIYKNASIDELVESYAPAKDGNQHHQGFSFS